MKTETKHETKSTNQDDKLIVEFLGGRHVGTERSDGHNYDLYDFPDWFPIKLSEPDMFGMKRTGYLGFGRQWDWIMPVWEHFRYSVWNNMGGYPEDFKKYKESFLTAVFNYSIPEARQSLIYAIQWYNSQVIEMAIPH